LRLCEEAARAGLEVAAVLHTDAFARDERARRLLESLRPSAGKIVAVGDGVMEQLSDTKSPQGVVLLARRPTSGPEVLDARPGASAPLLVVLHRVQNPSNAGAILRVAEAAGATAAVATAQTADLFSPKALRGAMGSTFRLPVWAGAELGQVLEWCARRGVRTVSTSLGAARTHSEIDWRGPRAVIVGSEGAGLGREEAEAADDSVRIPMRPPVESLNVAVAVAVVLYEAARQRDAG
jgi:TrmH family RNA methyltransferase